MRLPKLIASSVVRGAQLGESHGGLYLIDLERRSFELKLDWNRTDIDVSGRGGDRGLRGIGFNGEQLLVAANSELLVLDRQFKVVDSFTNPYLHHCHEISVANGHVFMASTGFDSVLAFDLKSKRFAHGFHLGVEGESLKLSRYDPMTSAGPAASRIFHINSVNASATGLSLSGLHTPGLVCLDGRNARLAAPLPPGTHNAQLFNGGVLYNDTASDRICYRSRTVTMQIDVPRFIREEIVNIERFESAVARPGFARGLCVLGEGLIAGGSSPSTVGVYDIRSGERLIQQNISMDVRDAIHGLAVWPY
jgi:hypothetical protein